MKQTISADRTATEAYAAARRSIGAKLATIKIALAAHERPDINWGSVSDLKHIDKLLAEINTFLVQ